MYHVPILDVGESAIFGSHAQDGWDSSLDILWQLEQQESDLTRQPEQKEPLSFNELQPSNAILQPVDDSAGPHATGTDRQADETQRRLQNRRVAQKRFRMRQKARVTVCCCQEPMHVGYTVFCRRSDAAGAETYCGNRTTADTA